MPLNYVEGYAVNPGGSVAYQEVPLGVSTPWGVRGTGTGLSYSEEPSAARLTVITFSGFAFTITDTGGVNGGQGNKLIYTFPAGLLQFLGANVALTLAADANLGATAAVVASLGKAAAATDNATLTADEITFVASTAATLTANAGAFSAVSGTTTAPAPIDGRSTVVPVYLNMAVPDAGITANAIVTVNGTIKLGWMVV